MDPPNGQARAEAEAKAKEIQNAMVEMEKTKAEMELFQVPRSPDYTSQPARSHGGLSRIGGLGALPLPQRMMPQPCAF